MDKTCESCGKDYDSKRSSSKYCGDRCRKLAFLSVPLSGVENANSDRNHAKLHKFPIVSVPKDAKSVDSVECVEEVCLCGHCLSQRQNGSRNIINHGAYKNYTELCEHEVNRVSLPGDEDYDGVWT